MFERGYEVAARTLRLHPHWLRLRGPASDLDGAFAAFRADRAAALLVLEGPITGIHRKRIAELAVRDRLPSLFPRDWKDARGLIAYGTSVVDAVARMPTYMDMPAEMVSRYKLIVNLKTAHQIGVMIPVAVLDGVDEVLLDEKPESNRKLGLIVRVQVFP